MKNDFGLEPKSFEFIPGVKRWSSARVCLAYNCTERRYGVETTVIRFTSLVPKSLCLRFHKSGSSMEYLSTPTRFRQIFVV